MKNIHVLFLCGWFPSRVLPTNGDFIKRHAQAVSKFHKVSVMHIVSCANTSHKYEIESENTGNLSIHIAYVRATGNPITKLKRFWNAYIKLLAFIEPFDIIHLNEIFPFGLFALHQKRKNKIPYIITEHWTGYLENSSYKISNFHQFCLRLISKNSSFICPVSDNLRHSLEKMGVSGNFEIVPNVVNTSIFTPDSKVKNKTFTILHVSDLNDTHKNISGMLRVAKKLKAAELEFHWKFVGGSQTPFQTLINELKLDNSCFTFTKHLKHAEIAKEMQQASVFVMLSNYENLPCVILESFSSGLPVISNNVGGIAEFFPKDFGVLINKGNEQEFFDAILKVKSNPIEKAKEMEQYTKENFSEKAIAKKFSNLYLKSLSN